MLSKSDLQIKHFGTTDWLEMMAKRDQRIMEDFLYENRPKDLKEWAEMDFPYCVIENELPCPLPTMAEIEATRGTEHDLTRDTSFSQQSVYRVSQVYAVKFSTSPLILQEAENLLFLANNTHITIPKVYAAFVHQGADPEGLLRSPKRFPDRSSLPNYYYLIMEYVSGKICDSDLWETLSDKAQQTVVRKAAQQLRLLRDVPTPSPEYYGRINHKGWFPNFPLLAKSGLPGHLRGPYDSHEDFVDATYTTSEIETCRQAGKDFAPSEKLYLQSFQQVMSRAAGKKPVLSHLDFKLQKVMVQEMDDKDDPNIIILDWAWMGWVPAYMDAALLFERCYGRMAGARFEWEMMRDVDMACLDTALYFMNFLEQTNLLA